MDSEQSIAPIKADDLSIVPGNHASADDLTAVFGTRDAGRCNCQRFKTRGWFWEQATDEHRRAQLRDQANCDDPAATSTTGLVAYLQRADLGLLRLTAPDAPDLDAPLPPAEAGVDGALADPVAAADLSRVGHGRHGRTRVQAPKALRDRLAEHQGLAIPGKR